MLVYPASKNHFLGIGLVSAGPGNFKNRIYFFNDFVSIIKILPEYVIIKNYIFFVYYLFIFINLKFILIIYYYFFKILYY